MAHAFMANTLVSSLGIARRQSGAAGDLILDLKSRIPANKTEIKSDQVFSILLNGVRIDFQFIKGCAQ
jgi:hypothetical protein